MAPFDRVARRSEYDSIGPRKEAETVDRQALDRAARAAGDGQHVEFVPRWSRQFNSQDRVLRERNRITIRDRARLSETINHDRFRNRR